MIQMLIHLVVVPLLLGRLIAYFSSEEDIIRNTVYGLLLSMAIFFIIYLPLMACEASFTVLVIAYSVVVGLLCVAGAVKFKGVKLWAKGKESQAAEKSGISTSGSNFAKSEISEKSTIFSWIYIAICAVLAALQLYFALFYTATNQTYDDYEYIVSAVDTIDTGRINSSYVLDGSYRGVVPKSSMNSWITFTAYLAKTSGLSVPVVCHTFLSVALLIVAYLIFYLIAKFLFEDSMENRWIFLDLVSVAVVFGSYSHNALPFRLLATVWQGKAVLAAVVIPFAILETARIFSKDYDKKKLLNLAVIALSGVTFTMVGTALMLVLYAAMFIAMSFYKKHVVSLKYAAVLVIPALIQVAFYVLLSFKIYGGLVT